MDKQEQQGICREIGARTGGDIYIGVVGPVRSGKSTFIKRFMEQLVLPAMGTEAARLRARDELPQSAAGRTIMTTEPKFIPETAVPLQLEGGGVCRVRLIDCVGYMVEGAMGHEENEKPRMVKSPWFDEEVPFDLAAETGTRRVIREHSPSASSSPPTAPSATSRVRGTPKPKSGSLKSWMHWANPTSSCSTAPARTPRKQSSWPRAWHGTTTMPFCR